MHTDPATSAFLNTLGRAVLSEARLELRRKLQLERNHRDDLAKQYNEAPAWLQDARWGQERLEALRLVGREIGRLESMLSSSV